MKTMKKIFFLLVLALVLPIAAAAQTPKDIINDMEQALKKGETEGLSMSMDIKVPVLGTTTSTVYMLGEKVRTEMTVFKQKMVIFSDGKTEYTYDSSNNKITITNVETNPEQTQSEAEENLGLFDDITDGYDVVLDKETADAWHLACKKQKSNPDKDAPKRMDLVVSKIDNLPVSLSTTLSGVKVTMKDIKLGVREEDVSFDINDYPGVTIEDKR